MSHIISPKILSGIVVEGGEALSIFEVSKYKCKLEISRESAKHARKPYGPYVCHNVSRPLSSNPLDGSYEAEWEQETSSSKAQPWFTIDPLDKNSNNKIKDHAADPKVKNKNKRSLLGRRSSSKSKFKNTNDETVQVVDSENIAVSIILTYAGDAIAQLGSVTLSKSDLCKPEQLKRGRGVITVPVQRRPNFLMSSGHHHHGSPSISRKSKSSSSNSNNVPKRRFELTRSAALSLAIEDTNYNKNAIIEGNARERSATTVISDEAVTSTFSSTTTCTHGSSFDIHTTVDAAVSPQSQTKTQKPSTERYLKHLNRVSLRAVSALEHGAEKEECQQEQPQQAQNPHDEHQLQKDVNNKMDNAGITPQEPSINMSAVDDDPYEQAENDAATGSPSSSSPLKSLMTLLLDIQPCGGVDSTAVCSKTSVDDGTRKRSEEP
uniref:Uncharacterized protein n=1 Tax=Leptocylindrus danicus TaxID=163516 RepID=A0A7S2K9C3_9STRA